MVKNFVERPHRSGGFFTGAQCNVTLSSQQHCLCYAVIDFYAYMRQWLTMLFSGPDNPKIAHFPWGPGPHAWFLGPTPVTPLNGISVGSAVFAGLMNVTNRQTHIHTDKQTDRPWYSICSNRMRLAIAAIRPNNSSHGGLDQLGPHQALLRNMSLISHSGWATGNLLLFIAWKTGVHYLTFVM